MLCPQVLMVFGCGSRDLTPHPLHPQAPQSRQPKGSLHALSRSFRSRRVPRRPCEQTLFPSRLQTAPPTENTDEELRQIVDTKISLVIMTKYLALSHFVNGRKRLLEISGKLSQYFLCIADWICGTFVLFFISYFVKFVTLLRFVRKLEIFN